MAVLAIPSQVIWSYFVGGVVFAIGLVAFFRRGDWQKAFDVFPFGSVDARPELGTKSAKSVCAGDRAAGNIFSGGALALAASLSEPWRKRGAHILATIARYLVAIPVLFFSFEQFMHGDHVPGIPLEPVTSQWVYGHAIWTYLAVVYAVAGALSLVRKKTRAAATWLGLAVFFVELVVYVPIGVSWNAPASTRALIMSPIH